MDDDSDSSSSSEVDEAVDNEANAGSTLPQVVDDHSRSVIFYFYYLPKSCYIFKLVALFNSSIFMKT